jgi:hypothetical protein
VVGEVDSRERNHWKQVVFVIVLLCCCVGSGPRTTFGVLFFIFCCCCCAKSGTKRVRALQLYKPKRGIPAITESPRGT